MNYIFYSYYIALLLKGKLKVVQISLSAILTLIVVFANIEGSMNYIIGKSSEGIDLLFLVLFVYSLMNLGYAAFNQYTPSVAGAEIKEEVKNKLPHQKNEVKPEKSKIANQSILQNKSYGSSIKSSPKALETKTEVVVPKGWTPIKREKVLTSKVSQKEEKAPEVDINTESTQEFFEDAKEEYHRTYTGVIDQNFVADISDVREIVENKIIETPFADTKSALYANIRDKNYN